MLLFKIIYHQFLGKNILLNKRGVEINNNDSNILNLSFTSPRRFIPGSYSIIAAFKDLGAVIAVKIFTA
jgi:hypothetical protein